MSIRTEHHVGELKLTISGDSIESLLTELAQVVARATGRASPEYGEWEQLSLSSRDNAALLADWINELIGRSEVNRRAYDDIRILHVEDGELSAEVRGRSVGVWKSDLKAATYHGLTLARRGQQWRATLLIDI